MIDASMFKKVLKGAYANLENNKQMVNNLNVFPVPDGDTGTNMSLTVKTAVEEMSKVTSDKIGDVAASMSSGALMGARGNSGVILSQLFRGFAKGLKDVKEIDIDSLIGAFELSTKMAYRAVMKPTEGTILTVAREMNEFAKEHGKSYSNVEEFVSHVLDAGEKSLQNTPNLLPVLKEAGVVDAGGRGLLCLFEGALKVLRGEEVIFIDVEEVEKEESGVKGFEIDSSDIKYGYCTEFLIKVHKENLKYESALTAALKDKLTPIGDSLVAVHDNGIIKIHVHTNVPWNAMKMAATCGDLSKIKIENMREQHNEIIVKSEEENKKEEEKYSSEEKDYIFIGVAAGSGMSKILKDLGMDYVIEGGQTMNPSTQDFLDIIDNTNGKNYILMPNNKNIIMAATQAKEISEKNIEVVKTRTIPECIAALMVFEPDSSIEDNAENMSEAMEEVKTGQVTFAVRDTSIGEKKISEGDILGILGSDIVADTKDISEATLSLIDEMVDDDSELISIYYGEDVKEADAEKIGKLVEEKYSDLDVEITYGGQPLYYYIVSVE
ncbi:DAK2 domain-containing protein [Anaerofustis stercorihominis]|uniref:DAK2 domain fusion protein YloV n=2 Tax=Anaerofustis stercorihominis TaxID=214853 RepID=B1C9C9_9FIRM|nr:DAK2 domain-containing protein [Anaerofustis stercorihominis]EDS72293.1 DAK2 domain fusion protein YloV [Anaerofustis stercorihominis DSM 17244]MCQ4795109.1 DAK2 domain-containing protein [Anaerofustis stercorihominis]